MKALQLLRGVALILLLGLVTGCGEVSAQRQGANDPAAQMRPDLLDVSASSTKPGQIIQVRFPQETGRGIAWALERQDGDGWRVLYYLTAGSANDGGSDSSWWSANDGEGRNWEDIGVIGPGPDTLTIPDNIEPGTYRLCTANSVDNICTMLDVDN